MIYNFILQIQDALQRATLDSKSQVGSIFQVLNTTESPPTYFQTNKFTSAFQEIVDAYGYVSEGSEMLLLVSLLALELKIIYFLVGCSKLFIAPWDMRLLLLSPRFWFHLRNDALFTILLLDSLFSCEIDKLLVRLKKRKENCHNSLFLFNRQRHAIIPCYLLLNCAF